jgi:MFS family permease
MINNLNDGMAWGLFPLYFAAGGLGLREMSILGALYPAVWGLVQLITGALSDSWGRKLLIVSGMVLQGAAILGLSATTGFASWALASSLLGVGTAMVYPTLLAAIGDVAHPSWRASAVGVYRLWRDGGYALGAVLAGLIADALGLRWAIVSVGALTVLSGVVAFVSMRETLPTRAPAGTASARVQ